jgi:hypothetical protein
MMSTGVRIFVKGKPTKRETAEEKSQMQQELKWLGEMQQEAKKFSGIQRQRWG